MTVCSSNWGRTSRSQSTFTSSSSLSARERRRDFAFFFVCFSFSTASSLVRYFRTLTCNYRRKKNTLKIYDYYNHKQRNCIYTFREGKEELRCSGSRDLDTRESDVNDSRPAAQLATGHRNRSAEHTASECVRRESSCVS